MRISSSKDDAVAHEAWHKFLAEQGVPHVYLDGVLQTHCTMADDEKGEVTRNVLDADGRVQVDPNDPELIWEETVRGKVEIKAE